MGSVQTPGHAKGRSHLRRNSIIAAVAAVSIAVLLVAVASFVFGVHGCFGGCGRVPRIMAVACYSDSKSCMLEVVGGPNSDSSADIVSCAFNVGSENVNGTVSWVPNGPQTTVSVPPAQTVTLYCSGFPTPPQVGGQIQGQLQDRGGWVFPFSNIWA